MYYVITVRWRNGCENRHNINLNEMSLEDFTISIQFKTEIEYE